MMTNSIYPSFAEFTAFAKKGNLIPLCMDVMSDRLTPVLLLGSEWNRNDYSFLLESVEGGETLGRYSIVSFEPEAILEEKEGSSELRTPRGRPFMKVKSPALSLLKRYMNCVKPVVVPGMPRFFGGAVGYCSYEMVHDLEHVPLSNTDPLGWSKNYFFITGDLFVFDNTQQLLKLISCVRVRDRRDVRAAYERGKRRLLANLKLVKNLKTSSGPVQRKSQPVASFSTNMKADRFVQAVKKAKEHIANGDIIQVVLSRRSEKRTTSNPLDIYRTLRVVNPSPYMYLMKIKDRAIIGSSPESLVRLENGMAMTRPIAGTRRRGPTPKEDQGLEKDLLKDPKELAEHLMLVDLGRNDLGRVCDFGSVSLPKFMTIERYSHVMHIVSEVVGKMKKGKDCFDLLKAVFPAGTVTGAPKIRAMEIIDELEKEQRGLYAGALGYVSYSGNMDMAITIRTILYDKGQVFIQTGAGIVADSDPHKEFEETENKAMGLKETIRLAESGQLF